MCFELKNRIKKFENDDFSSGYHLVQYVINPGEVR